MAPTRPAIAAISGSDADIPTISLSVLKPSAGECALPGCSLGLNGAQWVAGMGNNGVRQCWAGLATTLNSLLPPSLPAGGEVTAWAFSLWNSARNFAFIQNRAFTPSDGEGTTTDPYTASLTLSGIPDGVYTVTVTVTTATGTNTSTHSPAVVLGTPPAPSINAASGSAQAVTLSITVPQTVAVAANAAAGIRAGTTTASQPTVFTVTLRCAAGPPCCLCQATLPMQ